MSSSDPPANNQLLFDGLRADIETMPAAVEARLRKRLASAMVAATAPAAALGAGQVAGAAKASWLHSRAFAVALALPAGAALGALGHAWRVGAEAPKTIAPAPRRAPSAFVDAPRSLTPPIAVSALAVTPTAAAAPLVVSGKALPRSSSSDAPVALGLDGDLRLLEQARTQLADGDAATTLRLLRAHEHAYPASPLQQERDALTIKALVAAGRAGEAAERAEAFRARYPQGLLRDSVDRAVGKNP